MVGRNTGREGEEKFNNIFFAPKSAYRVTEDYDGLGRMTQRICPVDTMNMQYNIRGHNISHKFTRLIR